MNIAGTTPVEDPSYRYKMPKILAKVEGRGNGIKTLLVNVHDVGASLNREPAEVTKFFGCELGAQTIFATETGDLRAIVNGAHTAQDLQTHLSRYIENFVLCANCRLPETHYKIKTGIISQKCLACGHKGLVDMTHKLTTFILAQHKKAKEIADKAEKDKKKSDKKDKKDKAVKEAADEDAEVETKKKDKKDKDGEKKKSKKKASSDDLEKEGGADEADEEVSDSKAAGTWLVRCVFVFSCVCVFVCLCVCVQGAVIAMCCCCFCWYWCHPRIVGGVGGC